MNSAMEGVLPTLRAATDACAEGGTYYGPAGYGEFNRGAELVHFDSRAEDFTTAQRLWKASEVLTGVAYLL